MTPKNFKQIRECVVRYKIKPLYNRLIEAKQQVTDLEMIQMRYQEFERWCQYLIHGETNSGWSNFVYAMFVSKYSAELLIKEGQQRKLNEVDLIIVPDVLVPHKLSVEIPTSKKGVFTHTARMFKIPGIVTRIRNHFGNAKNIAIGTFADVMREPCGNCHKEALIACLDDYIDDDNGREFVIGQLCEYCLMITRIANFYKPLSNDPQFGVTDDIYHH